MTLAPCPACQRHLRSTEAACPFCGSRAGTAVVGLMLGLLALAGCGPKGDTQAPSPSAPPDAAGQIGNTDDGTGTAPPDAAGIEDLFDDRDQGRVQPMYGVDTP